MSRAFFMAITARKGAMTIKQLAAEAGINPSSARTNINRARAHGTKYLRIADYVGGQPRYAPRPEPDCEPETTEKLVTSHLADYPKRTIRKLSEELDLPLGRVDAQVRRLHAARRIHISGWENRKGKTGGGKLAAQYSGGNRRDVPKPGGPEFRRAAWRRQAGYKRVRRILEKNLKGKKE